MKTNLQGSPTSKVKWPDFGKIEVAANVDFVYIVRKDADFALEPLGRRIAADYKLDYGTTRQILLEAYDVFFTRWIDALQQGFAAKGNVEVHIYDSHKLGRAVRAKSQSDFVISLDPLMSREVYEFKTSRSYYLGGMRYAGQTARPGSPPLLEQAQSIKAQLGTTAVSIIEDDIFSGHSAIAALTKLQESGISIKKITTGIYMEDAWKNLATLGIPIESVVRYGKSDDKNVFDKIDLGDPRDFLIGASGLVVKIPGGKLGRSPYLLPFVSVTARTSIPPEAEDEFSVRLLNVNLAFFERVWQQLGRPMLLRHMNPGFVTTMRTLFNFDEHTPMDTIVNWALHDKAGIWASVKAQGIVQEKVSDLKLPPNIAFVDVNGTLFSDDSTDGHIPAEDIDLFKQTIAAAAKHGLTVGLCSDSPLPMLKKLARRLTINGPIVAENGSLLHYRDQTVVINTLACLKSYKEAIRVEAKMLGLTQGKDVTAQEFGGGKPTIKQGRWAFGAGRQATITVFGSPELIRKLGEKFKGQQEITVDSSPEYNFFAVHPGQDYRQIKGQTLDVLAAHGHAVTMIGNSMADWVDPAGGVRCAFVAHPRITRSVMQQKVYVSKLPLIKGVIDVIRKIS